MAMQQRKTGMLPVLIGVLSVCSAFGQEEAGDTNAVDEVYNRARYELIVAREPFGAEPLMDEEKKEAATLQALEREYRLCFLMESTAGEFRAGLENKQAKKGEPKSIVLREGESFGTLKLLEIDLTNSSAKILYQGKEVSFTLEKPAAKRAVAKPAAAKPPTEPQRRFGGGFRRTQPPAAQPPAAPPPVPKAPQMTPEELAVQRAQVKETLREYQMEVLRQGMPPLPVQLTPEQDAQLVEEGVLQPLE